MNYLAKIFAPLTILLLVLLMGAEVVAQSEAPKPETTVAPEPEAPEDSPEADQTTAPQSSADAKEDEEDKQQSNATLERFTPSEEISADRSVAFPNDI